MSNWSPITLSLILLWQDARERNMTDLACCYGWSMLARQQEDIDRVKKHIDDLKNGRA